MTHHKPGLCILLAALALPALAHEATKPKAATAAPAKPNGSGVQFRYNVPSRLQVNQPATVRLRFSGVRADDARVEIKVPAGLTVASATSAALPRGQDTTLELTVTPTVDGLHYLDVFTTQNGRTSAQSVPVATGSARAQLKRAGTAQTTPSGEKIVSLPAAQ